MTDPTRTTRRRKKRTSDRLIGSQQHPMANLAPRKGWCVVQDKKYPTMYRLQSKDGTLTDMVNISRAYDALIASRVSDRS